MSEAPPPSTTNWPGLLVGIAAVIGALALLVFALSGAGLLGRPATAPTATVVAMVASTAPPAGYPESAGTPTAAGAEGEDQAPYPGSTVEDGEPLATPAGGGAFTDDTPVPAGPTALPGEPDGAPTGTGTLTVEDWSAYDDRDVLEAAYSTNLGWANNDLTLSLLDATESPQGPAGVEAAYDITTDAPNDYVGFERDLDPHQDWLGYNTLAVWAMTDDPSNRQLVLQWHEASGEVWRHRTKLGALPIDGPLLVPLSAEAWEWANWSDEDNGQLDLDEVTHLGIFIGHDGPGSGYLQLGTIELLVSGEAP